MICRCQGVDIIIKTEPEIRERIFAITESNRHVLDCGPATVDINAPRALMQLTATTALNELYGVLNEERPRYKCDDAKLTDR